jgi:hypothetical protein
MFSFNTDDFLASYQTEFPTPALGDGAKAGLAQLLGFLAEDPNVTDVRWAAYMLATVKHECADTWRPIEEYGKGQGRPYGTPVIVTVPDGTQYSNVYYGRGFVQLTWKQNYDKMGQALGSALALHPEQALEPAMAYNIMSHGMRAGSFTGLGLGRYIHDDGCDYLNARRIINALDQAERIAGYAQKLESLLRASLEQSTVAGG